MHQRSNSELHNNACAEFLPPVGCGRSSDLLSAPQYVFDRSLYTPLLMSARMLNLGTPGYRTL
jgi:hypothetical protein